MSTQSRTWLRECAIGLSERVTARATVATRTDNPRLATAIGDDCGRVRVAATTSPSVATDQVIGGANDEF